MSGGGITETVAAVAATKDSWSSGSRGNCGRPQEVEQKKVTVVSVAAEAAAVDRGSEELKKEKMKYYDNWKWFVVEITQLQDQINKQQMP